MKENLDVLLFDPATREFTEQFDDEEYRFLKCRYNEETDFLYILSAPEESSFGFPVKRRKAEEMTSDLILDTHDVCPLRIDRNAIYAGIISYPTRNFYCFPFHPHWFTSRWIDLEDRVFEAEDAIAERVRQIVHDQPVPVGPEAEEVYQAEADREAWLEYAADDEVNEAFFSRKEPAYAPRVSLQPIATDMIARIINHFDETVKQEAERYVRSRAGYINHRLWMLGVIRERCAALEATPGDHHLRREAAESK